VTRKRRAYLVSGRVQGVGFRAFVADAARNLGLAGLARNLPDGRVEVVAEGLPRDLDALESELRTGPRFARVSAVVRADNSVKLDDVTAFIIK